MEQFDNIIFDYGGVIINIDTFKTINEFAEISGKDPLALYQDSLKYSVFPDFEKGLISEIEFVEGVRELLGADIGDQQIIEGWNAMILDIPAKRIELLKQLSANKNIFLLSNTNSIHLTRVGVEVRKVMNQDLIDPLFNKAYYSHLMGMRKPDSEIYDFVISENELDPSKTLFLDDNPDNLKGAEKLGIQTIQVTEEHGIIDIFRI